MRKSLLSLFAAAAFFFAAPAGTQAKQDPTRVCLALVGDSSDSVEGPLSITSSLYLKEEKQPEYIRMVLGMAEALRHPKVVERIIENAPVAMAYIEYANVTSVRLNWVVMRTAQDVHGFANMLEGLARTLSGGTQTYPALVVARDLLKRCPGRDLFTRDVIDLATDDQPDLPQIYREGARYRFKRLPPGPLSVSQGMVIDGLMNNLRDSVANDGITLNVLAMNTERSVYRKAHGYDGFKTYLARNVANGQVFDVSDGNYAAAFVRKFMAEISSRKPPEPKRQADHKSPFAIRRADAIIAFHH